MDPVSCVALATGAFKALKGAVAAGRDFQDMTSQLSTWGKAFSDFNELEKREKDPPFWKKTFKGSRFSLSNSYAEPLRGRMGAEARQSSQR